MAVLKPIARHVLNRKEFSVNIKRYLKNEIEWSDDSLQKVKSSLRKILRISQNEICPYCQRLIFRERRNHSEHIEHFLDKSRKEFRKFAFSVNNLVLSCGACNVEKGTKNLVPSGRASPTYLTSAAGPFRWPHPYFDDMSACIKKNPGPVYSIITGSGKEDEAKNLISDLKLDTVRDIESRRGRLQYRQIRLRIILTKLINSNKDSRRETMKSIMNEINKVADKLDY